MPDLLLDVIEYLQYEGIVQGDADDCYRDHMPEEPDKIISFREISDGDATGAGRSGIHRMFQVAVRSSLDHPEWARDKIWDIFNVLDTPDRVLDMREIDDENEVYESDRWGVVEAIGTPARIKVDENGRSIYSFNVSIVTSRD